MMSEPLIVTIDGPAGAGKSTTARRVAESLGYVYIDTGAMYRAVTLEALRTGTTLDEKGLAALMEKIQIELRSDDRGQRTLLNGEDVSEAIRRPDVTANVSRVSAEPIVRERLVAIQREIGSHGGVVMDGRDIGSVVFPHAHVKVFLVADLYERARRRIADTQGSDDDITLEEMVARLAERDRLDSSRATSPLLKPEGAVEVDTTHLTITQQVDLIVQLARNYQKAHAFVASYGNPSSPDGVQ